MHELNFVHICEKAFLSDNNELNIISDLDEIKIDESIKDQPVPVSFYVVTNFTVTSNEKYSQKISIVEKDSSEKPIFESDEIQQSTMGNKIGLILKVNTKLEYPKTYSVSIILNGEPVKILDLKVS